ncbi:hypothetical protein DFS34DRAFT_34646 [Phlyctochytrium arcticum]|nr:hypothetical protein DFS34DRAFT_34646 [Phlyctochytrium arcticum]
MAKPQRPEPHVDPGGSRLDFLVPPHGTHHVNPEEFQQPPLERLWIPNGTKLTGTFEDRLSEEIDLFVKYMGPTQEEIDLRKVVVSRYEQALRPIFPKCQLRLFGSLGTELLLPTSDIDVILHNPDEAIDTLTQKIMAKRLRKARPAISRMMERIFVLPHAKIPILQGFDRHTKIKLDISYNNLKPLDQIQTVRGFLRDLPHLRELVLVMKQFLHCRQMDDASIGTIGGYTLVLWMAAFLKMHRDIFPHRYVTAPTDGGNVSYADVVRNPALRSPSAGHLLLDFFLLFGRVFDYREHGLSPGDPDKEWVFLKNGGRPYVTSAAVNAWSLVILDPNNLTGNVAAPAHKIDRVTSHLAMAYEVLMSAKDNLVDKTGPEGSILGQILRVERETLEGRPRFVAPTQVPKSNGPANPPGSPAQSRKRKREQQQQQQLQQQQQQKQQQQQQQKQQQQQQQNKKQKQQQQQQQQQQNQQNNGNSGWRPDPLNESRASSSSSGGNAYGAYFAPEGAPWATSSRASGSQSENRDYRQSSRYQEQYPKDDMAFRPSKRRR